MESAVRRRTWNPPHRVPNLPHRYFPPESIAERKRRVFRLLKGRFSPSSYPSDQVMDFEALRYTTAHEPTRRIRKGMAVGACFVADPVL